MLNYHPERILVDAEVEHSFLTEEICERFADVPQYVIRNDSDQNLAEAAKTLKTSLTKGKKTLHLKRFKGNALKNCPGWSRDSICCDYLTLDLIENCPFECTYCILQAFLNKPLMTIHVNLEEILADLKNSVLEKPQQLFRIGTGEHSDSLALDPFLKINPYLIQFFSKLPNAVLELKTKSDHVDHLLDLPHGGRTVISWSLNPEKIVKQEEHKTASLSQRLEAAKKASTAGYKLGFHFDPILHFHGWEQQYRDLVEMVFDYVEPKRVAWISMGTLRCLPGLKPVVEERFPASRVFLGELYPANDGKLRYQKNIRQQMIQSVRRNLDLLAPGVPTYICMDKSTVWKNSMSFKPNSSLELEKMLGAEFCKDIMAPA